MSDAKIKLSDCIRPTVEAAPWVIEAVLELENKLAAALDDLEVAKNIANGNVEAKFDAWKQLDAMEHELAAALAACEAKDEALREISGSNAPHIIVAMKALAIQPNKMTQDLADGWLDKYRDCCRQLTEAHARIDRFEAEPKGMK